MNDDTVQEQDVAKVVNSDSPSKSEVPKSNPLFILLVIFNSLLTIFLIFNQSKVTTITNDVISKESPKSTAKKALPYYPTPSDGHIIEELEFGEFTANLARPDGPQRFIKLTIYLIIESPQVDPMQEIINKTSSIRDSIFELLNTLTPKEVLKLEGREVLKDRILRVFEHHLKKDKVKKILFTRFQVN